VAAASGTDKRALALLSDLGFEPYAFQGEAVERAVAASQSRERLLIQAPTGAGKTLIAYLAVAVLKERIGNDFRALVVVPSRPLLRQHIVDAGWLRGSPGVPIHMLSPDDSMRMWHAVLHGPGLICTTPHSLRSRLPALGGLTSLPRFDLVQFDEIDLFLTVDLIERRDIWPVLDECLTAQLPVVGYTGTSLSPVQEKEWASRAFTLWEPEIPEEWIPFTRIEFAGIRDEGVITSDADISEQLKNAYRRYEQAGGNPHSWRQIKIDARGSGQLSQEARAILTLHAERLKLFEGDRDSGGKLRRVIESLRGRTGLVLSRYIFSASHAAGALTDAGVRCVQADGRMSAGDADRAAQAFRRGEVPVLVMTRDLGGRGLDFPNAQTAVLLSPRTNYQTVAQELARIRSRRGNRKTVTVLFYEDTTEALKASRLATHLVRDNRYGSQPLFEVADVPEGRLPENPFERAHFSLEESVPRDFTS
jgi:superfamily II DNA or RNA helicase